MNRTLEDRLGMGLLLIVFGWLLVRSLKGMAALVAAHDTVPMWELILLSRVSNLVFLGMIVWFTATRLPARNAATGLMPRLVAIAGTFVMMLVAVAAPVEVGPVQRVVSTVLVVLGTVLSILCLTRLGRSFSVVASARALVTAGPYRIVRHPLYAAELVAVLGVTMSNGSAAAYALGLSCLAFQIARARLEEKVLAETFPEYAGYARRVPMLIPGLNGLLPRRAAPVGESA
ncbi:isoprenylcysteine carboxylmethyltransferase family protein [Rhodobacter sp. SGA-6-6]|uniref:methyltransferase family protein n=1 Tax=Rhodobacter sp. SGA-6-6 TaxID=2710882 RepID=UPI0013EAC9DB|nr:isoprenylcysteine carboxylmethyltransferase family protein [Rhodobacter sp. SGA-6-6]NGM45333.1 isoprenylcysteine carboxylmethyltransferase family protein [Rhodobacter sp. SGA-6-6]